MTACEVCGGACCTHFFIGKSMMKGDAQKYFGLRGVDKGDKIRIDMPCSALKGGRCSVYDTRPQVCKDDPVGGPKCVGAIMEKQPERFEEISRYFKGGNMTTVKAIKTDSGDWVLEVLGIPYGGPYPGGKDKVGDYFDNASKIHEDKFPTIPAVFAHGLDPVTAQPVGKPEYIGKATHARVDERGHWYQVVLNKASEYARKIWEAALKGLAGASSGAIGHLVRRSPDGHLDEWPAAELTLIDGSGNLSPMNPYAVALPVLKTIYEEAGLKLDDPQGGEPGQNETQTTKVTGDKMAEEKKEEIKTAPVSTGIDLTQVIQSVLDQQKQQEAQAKAKTEAEAQIKSQVTELVGLVMKAGPPINGGAPALNLKTRRGDDAHKAFAHWCRTGDPSGIRTGEAYDDFMKTTYTLLEGTQYVGQEAVPTEVYNKIIEKRDAISILRRGGCQVIPCSSNALVVPIEKTSPDKFVLTTEGSAFDVTTAQPMDKLTATVYMYTKTVAVSLQLLEDSAFDIEAWWGRRLGRAWGLTENDFGLVGTGSSQPLGCMYTAGASAGVSAAATNTVTAAEVVSLYNKLPFEYRDNVSWVMAQASEATVRGLTITNTFPFVGTGGTQGGVGNIGLSQGSGWLVDPSSKVFVSASAPAMTTGLKSILVANFEALYCIVERKGLTVFRDPYTLAGNGEVSIHAYFREGGGPVNITAGYWMTQA